MGLLAKYDAAADRMRLALQSGSEPPLLFWVTRRQWLGWLHALAKVPALPPSEGAPEAPATGKRERQTFPEAGEPVLVKRISVRTGAQGIKILFALESRVLAVELPMATVSQLQAMLQQQAEYAGWDAAAALVRLDAATDASKVISNARKPR